MRHSNRPNRRTQRAAALLTAMIIVTLVATLASAMVWRQYRAVQIEAAERARAQASWILQGSLDWARLILREDARADHDAQRRGEQAVDHLGEVWAVPLAEARLSTFLAADKSNADDGPEAFLSGSLEDAQSRYNLRHLLAGKVVPPLEQKVLERLTISAGAPPGTAALIIDKMRSAYGGKAESEGQADSGDKGDKPLQPRSIDQLAWFGLSAATLERLRPLITLLPVATPVNLNTAPREVIAALFDGMDLGSAERLVQARQARPLTKLEESADFFPKGVVVGPDRASVTSAFFFVNGRLRLEERVLDERSLVQRRDLDIMVLDRQRVVPKIETKP